MQNDHWVQVRSLREGRKLLFRFDPVRNLIEVKIQGTIEIVRLDDYRPLQQNTHQVGIDFARIDGGEILDG